VKRRAVELRIAQRPDLGYWKPLINASLCFADPQRATAACKVCNATRSQTDRFCWNDQCPTSPIYFKLPIDPPLPAATELLDDCGVLLHEQGHGQGEDGTSDDQRICDSTTSGVTTVSPASSASSASRSPSDGEEQQDYHFISISRERVSIGGTDSSSGSPHSDLAGSPRTDEEEREGSFAGGGASAAGSSGFEAPLQLEVGTDKRHSEEQGKGRKAERLRARKRKRDVSGDID